MKNYLKKFCSSFLAVILAVSSVFAAMPATIVLAATDTYGASQTTVKGERVDENAVNATLDAINRVRRTGSREDYIKARNLIAALRPVDRLRIYSKLIGDYYLKNYKNTGFRYFNAQKYLEANEDVRLDALRYSPDDIYAYALKHYLEHGILEGRSSGTDFDPMVAILARPDILFDIIVLPEDEISDTLYISFFKKTGKTTTESYTVLGDSLVVIEKDSINGAFPTDSTQDARSSDSQSSGSSSDSTGGEDEPAHQKEYRTPRYINNKAKDITPYVLYRNSFDNETFSFTSYNPFDDVNNNKNVNVIFRGENYRQAKKLAKGKKYTLMLYCCGTNLESAPDYRRVSAEIVSMLQADMNNVNVILCVGGTNTYGSDFFNDSEYGASGLRAGIYYLNPDGLSDYAKARIMNVNTNDSDTIFQLGGQGGTDLSNGLRFNDIFTTDSLIPLVNTSAVDMADPSFLAGFINLSTNLFPADDYGLTLSDHGGGLEGGVIFTDSKDELESNGISVYKLESALASTDLYRDKDVSTDGKFGVIFYSACTMGSTELAYLTKDYYRYMIASEECTSGHDSYRHIISGLNYDVGHGATDVSIAKNIAMAYENNTESHHGFNDYIVGSIAVFSSEDMDNIREKINELAAELSKILGNDDHSEEMKRDVFIAIRKASLSCYPTVGAFPNDSYGRYLEKTSYVDIGGLLNYVKKNLDDVYQNGYSDYSLADKAEFDRLREKLDYALNTGFLVYLSMYNKEMGGIYANGMGNAVIPLNYTMNTSGNIWTDIRTDEGNREYLYGSSIYLPLIKSPDSFMSESEFYKYFKDSDLNDYVGFITDYLTYFNDRSKYNTQDLCYEMANIRMDKLITQVNDAGNVLTTLEDDKGNSRDYITFKIADSYEDVGLAMPEHSLGNPMLDILETQPAIMVAAVHKQQFDAKRAGQEGFLEVNMICAEQAIPTFAFALATGTISFDVTDTKRSIITAMTMEGKALGNDSDDIDWQFVLRSDKEADETDKLEILKTIFPEVQQISDVDTITVFGKYKPQAGEDTECYHVFKVKEDDNYQYSYEGSVRTVTDEEGNYSFEKAEGVIAVSAYHYVLKEEVDESGETKYTKVALEQLNCVGDGFFDVQGHELVLNKDIYVTQYVSDEAGYTGKATAYSIDPYGGGDYSDLGYVSERDFNTGNTNVGNGPLAVIEYAADAEVAGIGTFGTEGPEYDTDTSDDSKDPDLPIHSVGYDDSESVEELIENNASRDPKTVDEPHSIVDEDCENEENTDVVGDADLSAPNPVITDDTQEIEEPAEEITEEAAEEPAKVQTEETEEEETGESDDSDDSDESSGDGQEE